MSAATLGAASWQRRSKFEIVIGPLTFESFLQFLPGTRALRELAALIRLYTNGRMELAGTPAGEEDECPGVSLGAGGKAGLDQLAGHEARHRRMTS